MATEKFANNPVTTLNGGVDAVITSIIVTDASAFPATSQFRLKVENEIMLITGVAGNTFTATRGAEGTTAATHSNGVLATHVLTAGAMDLLVQTDDTRLSDDRTASGVKTATTTVVVSSATAPSAGQVLTATSSTAATWETPTFLANVSAVALSNITLSSPDWTASTWDGVTVSVGARVLLTQQTTNTENGTYIRPSSGAMSRTTDVIACGSRVQVEQGEIYAGCSFVQDTVGPITIGSSPLAWACTDGPRLAAPLTNLIGSGAAGSWVTLLTIPGPAVNDYDLVLVVDNVATKSDGTVIARSRGPTTYRRAAGVLTLSDDSRYLTAATYLQQVISSSDVLLQGFQQSLSGGDYSFRIRTWFEYVRAL